MTKLTTPINILVQRRASIGDVIMTTGVVRELKKQFKDNANIIVATDVLEVYKNNPHIAGVVPVASVDRKQFDVVYDLDNAYELNPYTNYIEDYFYRVFGPNSTLDHSVELFPTPEDYNAVRIDGDYIVVHLRNWHWQAKNIDMSIWFEVFAKVFEVNDAIKIICVGGKTDNFIDHPNFIDARDKYTSQQLKALCDGAKCFVGIDSGPFQCAAASKTHIIGLLTHLLPERIMPERKYEYMYNATAIQTQEDCAGCNDTQPRPIHQIICKKTDFPCTRNFDADIIAQSILKSL